MLASQYRLPATIKLKQPHVIHTDLFNLKYTENSLKISRFAFVVKKSVNKRAVVRNRVRRVFRSCIEELNEHIFPGYDMLFFLEKGIMDVKREYLLQEVTKILEGKGLLVREKDY